MAVFKLTMNLILNRYGNKFNDENRKDMKFSFQKIIKFVTPFKHIMDRNIF